MLKQLAATSAVLSTVIVTGSAAEELIPHRDLAAFVVQTLDLASFPNSFGPRREAGLHTFADFNLKPSKLSASVAEFETPEWFYEIDVKGVRDFSGDGFKDIEICFSDRSLKSTYRTRTTVVVTRRSSSDLLKAIGDVKDGC